MGLTVRLDKIGFSVCDSEFFLDFRDRFEIAKCHDIIPLFKPAWLQTTPTNQWNICELL